MCVPVSGEVKMIMISTSRNNYCKFYFVTLLAAVSFLGNIAFAQVSQTISVSPTLFDMKVAKEQSWQSEIRVTNVNDYDITVYPQVVNFAPLGETGRGDFIPVFEEETQGKTLAEWIHLPPAGITISRQETKTISFNVSVPKDAAPGGHYAAILIGTKPPVNNGSSEVQTAQFVTTLFFLRVDGDISERGTIREFTTAKNLIAKPEAEFLLRFENEGNVHLQPQGDITIYNMWGQERGRIPINQQTHFGNVLPNSIRQFTFSWNGEYSLLDIGRYKAIATLGYGQDIKNFVTSATYFWIIPWQQILIVLLVISFLIWFVSFAVRLYVKRVLLLAGIETRRHQGTTTQNNEPSIRSINVEKTVIIKRYQTVTAPMVVGVFDFLTSWRSANSWRSKIKATSSYIVKYRMFFSAFLAFCLLVLASILYVQAVTKVDRSYQVTINSQDSKIKLSSEQIIYDSLPPVAPASTSTTQSYQLTISNASGKSGVAADTRVLLEDLGYTIKEIVTDSETPKEASVIVYNSVPQADLLQLSAVLGKALISASNDLPVASVIIYVGKDRSKN